MPGLFNAYRASNVMIANALGTGVSPTTSAVYAYVPRLIRYYLAEEPILDNVETFLCREEKSLSHVLANLDKLVVKAVEQIRRLWHAGRSACQPGRARRLRPKTESRSRELYRPAHHLQLSTAPTFCRRRCGGARHVDLRPTSSCHGAETKIVPGALTRVALKRGSLVVNSSQGERLERQLGC